MINNLSRPSVSNHLSRAVAQSCFQLKVLFVLPSEDHLVGHAASLRRALEYSGHQIVSISAKRHTKIWKFKRVSNIVYRLLCLESIPRIMQVFQPDLILNISGEFRLSAESLSIVGDSGIRILQTDGFNAPWTTSPVQLRGEKVVMSGDESQGVWKTVGFPAALDMSQYHALTASTAPARRGIHVHLEGAQSADFAESLDVLGQTYGQAASLQTAAALVVGPGMELSNELIGEIIRLIHTGGAAFLHQSTRRLEAIKYFSDVFIYDDNTDLEASTEAFMRRSSLASDSVAWSGSELPWMMYEEVFERIFHDIIPRENGMPCVQSILPGSDIPSDRLDKSEKPKIIAVTGWYGEGNIGDEIILESIMQSITRVSPDSQVVVASPRPSAVEALHGVGSYPRHEMRSMSSLAQYADCLIVGGGGIWNDKAVERNGGVAGLFQSPKYSASNLATLPLMFSSFGKPVSGIGLGVGPISTVAGRACVRLMAKCCDHISVRDENSSQLLESLGRELTSVHVDPDLAYSWTPYDRIPRLRRANSRELLIGVNVRCLDGDSGFDAHRFGLLDALASLADLYTCSFVGIPMHAADEEPIRDLLAQSGVDIFEVLPFSSDTSQVAADLAELDMMISMRLHASILSHMAGVPTIGLDYETKVGAYFHEIGEADRLVSLDGSTATEALKDLSIATLSDLPTIGGAIRHRYRHVRSTSLKALDENIGKLLELAQRSDEPLISIE